MNGGTSETPATRGAPTRDEFVTQLSRLCEAHFNDGDGIISSNLDADTEWRATMAMYDAAVSGAAPTLQREGAGVPSVADYLNATARIRELESALRAPEVTEKIRDGVIAGFLRAAETLSDWHAAGYEGQRALAEGYASQYVRARSTPEIASENADCALCRAGDVPSGNGYHSIYTHTDERGVKRYRGERCAKSTGRRDMSESERKND